MFVSPRAVVGDLTLTACKMSNARLEEGEKAEGHFHNLNQEWFVTDGIYINLFTRYLRLAFSCRVRVEVKRVTA